MVMSVVTYICRKLFCCYVSVVLFTTFLISWPFCSNLHTVKLSAA